MGVKRLLAWLFGVSPRWHAPGEVPTAEGWYWDRYRNPYWVSQATCDDEPRFSAGDWILSVSGGGGHRECRCSESRFALYGPVNPTIPPLPKTLEAKEWA